MIKKLSPPPILLTAPEVAKMSGRSMRSVQRAARRLGIVPTGRHFVFTKIQAEAVIAEIKEVGNPNFG